MNSSFSFNPFSVYTEAEETESPELKLELEPIEDDPDLQLPNISLLDVSPWFKSWDSEVGLEELI